MNCKKVLQLCTNLKIQKLVQSLQRKIKRGHARVKMSEFVKNEDGTPKVIIEKRSKRGIWYKSQFSFFIVLVQKRKPPYYQSGFFYSFLYIWVRYALIDNNILFIN